jgi:hypothetical protein
MWLTVWEIIKYYTPFLEPATDVYRLNTGLLIFLTVDEKYASRNLITVEQTSPILCRKRAQYNTYIPNIKSLK